VQEDVARSIVDNRLPVGAPQAARIGLIDACAGEDLPHFHRFVAAQAQALAASPAFEAALASKVAGRAADEARKPLAQYRAEELARMQLNFYGFDPSYHVARYNFVFKVPKSRTPLYLARHRVGVAARARTLCP
jgi:putative two-component system hydrogenase maturation factor HypX/HoxX